MNKKVGFGVFAELPPPKYRIDDDNIRICSDATMLLSIIYPIVEDTIWESDTLNFSIRDDFIKNKLYDLEQYSRLISRIPAHIIGQVVTAAARLAMVSANYPCVDLLRVFRDFEKGTKYETIDM